MRRPAHRFARERGAITTIHLPAVVEVNVPLDHRQQAVQLGFLAVPRGLGGVHHDSPLHGSCRGGMTGNACRSTIAPTSRSRAFRRNTDTSAAEILSRTICAAAVPQASPMAMQGAIERATAPTRRVPHWPAARTEQIQNGTRHHDAIRNGRVQRLLYFVNVFARGLVHQRLDARLVRVGQVPPVRSRSRPCPASPARSRRSSTRSTEIALNSPGFRTPRTAGRRPSSRLFGNRESACGHREQLDGLFSAFDPALCRRVGVNPVLADIRIVLTRPRPVHELDGDEDIVGERPLARLAELPESSRNFGVLPVDGMAQGLWSTW